MNGAGIVCRTLEELGAEIVFGLPGSQNVALFEALRTSRLRTIVAVHELGASFMANGYARASGRPGILTTIPGPGFTYALTGLAEAFLDSVPIVYILVGSAAVPGRRFQLQALDQRSVLSPIVKRVIDVAGASEIEPALRSAYALSREGEPGPVVVQIPPSLFDAEVVPSEPALPEGEAPEPDYGPIARRLAAARRPLFYVGQGAFDGGDSLLRLVEALGAPVVTTTSARGVLPEDHPRVLRFDRRRTELVNELVESADLVLALGCKFSHNGAHGFRLRLPPDRLVHVDASSDVLGANYAASLTLAADVPRLLQALVETLPVGAREASGWTDGEIRSWKAQAMPASVRSGEPRVLGYRPPTPEAFFASLRRIMPRDSCLVLDSGLHQMLARRYFPVFCPRGLLLPTDLQSMGFAIPAAIGARIAKPRRPVVALLGDGGFAMSGLEILTAVRERVPLTVIVFNDGRYGLIYNHQINAYGKPHGTALLNPDIRGLAEAAGASYLRLSARHERKLASAIRGKGVTVVEVVLRSRRRRLRRAARSALFRLKQMLVGGC